MTREEFESAAAVSRETSERFDIWRRGLIAWSAHTNLVGRATLDDFWARHALDSWQVMDHIPPDARRIWDLGAGAGMPGLAIAFGLMERGQAGEVVLVDSVAKKARFLDEIIQATGAPARALPVRAETIDPAQAGDVVTSRAMAPLHKLLGFAKPLLKNYGIGVFLKGRRYADELTEARKSWTFDVEVIPSRTSDGAILKFREVKRV